jgi:hypothetical protein
MEDVLRRAVDRPRLRRPHDAAAAVVHWPVDGSGRVGRCRVLGRRGAPSGITRFIYEVDGEKEWIGNLEGLAAEPRRNRGLKLASFTQSQGKIPWRAWNLRPGPSSLI